MPGVANELTIPRESLKYTGGFTTLPPRDGMGFQPQRDRVVYNYVDTENEVEVDVE